MDELSYIPVGAKEATLVAGSNISTTLAGVTSGHFGRTATDANTLYLATSGGKSFFLFSLWVLSLLWNDRVLILNSLGIGHQRNGSCSRKHCDN